MDPLSLAVGGALLLVGWLAGRVARPPRVASSSPSSYVCECEHSLSFHDVHTGACGWSRYSGWYGRTIGCACRCYVGDRPPADLDPADVLRALGSDLPTSEDR